MLAPFGIRPKGTLLARMLPLAQALHRRAIRCVIIAPAVHNPEDAGTRYTYDGVDVIHTPAPQCAGPTSVLQHIASLTQATLAEQPTLIHLFKPKGYSGLAALALRQLVPRIPLVVDTDDWEGWGGWNDLLPYPQPAKHLFAWQERNLPRHAAAVTVASQTLQTQVWGFGVPAERVFLIPNGTQNAPPPTTLRSGNRLLLYTRFWEFDLIELVQALVAIHQARPDVRLLVIGSGERGQEHELAQRVERAGIRAMLDLRGWVAPEQIGPLLAGSDLALAPLSDTLINRARGMAKLLELMQAGLPIVAHRVGVAGEYLEHNQSGLLVAPGDTAGFARAVLDCLNDPALRMRLGSHAYQRATTVYSWDAIAATAVAAYAYARNVPFTKPSTQRAS